MNIFSVSVPLSAWPLPSHTSNTSARVPSFQQDSSWLKLITECYATFLLSVKNCHTSFLNVSFIVLPWFVTINVQLQIKALSIFQCRSVSALALTVCVCVSLLSPLRVVHLWPFLSVSSRHLSQGSPPRRPALPRQWATLPMPLSSPPVWLFTASSVSISTAAPLLTKAYSRRTGKGHHGAWRTVST